MGASFDCCKGLSGSTSSDRLSMQTTCVTLREILELVGRLRHDGAVPELGPGLYDPSSHRRRGSVAGSTEQRALDALTALGAQVEVSYDTSTTRLHAKAWMFQRASGFSTVYIGSSNLTFSAQVDGLEWNVRASQRLNPDLIASFERTFATSWADPHFAPFDTERFARATAAAQSDDSILNPFEIEPYPFQRQILERLQVERPAQRSATPLRRWPRPSLPRWRPPNTYN